MMGPLDDDDDVGMIAFVFVFEYIVNSFRQLRCGDG